MQINTLIPSRSLVAPELTSTDTRYWPH